MGARPPAGTPLTAAWRRQRHASHAAPAAEPLPNAAGRESTPAQLHVALHEPPGVDSLTLSAARV